MADPHRVELRTVSARCRAGRGHRARRRESRRRRRTCWTTWSSCWSTACRCCWTSPSCTLEWAPAPEVFVAAVTSAGGWPYARLVLFGADGETAERLRSCRVPEAVFLAGTLEQAAALVDVRPDWLSRGIDLPARPESVHRAREFLRDTDDRWGLPDRDDVASVVTELVTNAVAHAGTGLRLRLVLDRTGSAGVGPRPAPRRRPVGPGLRDVARLSRSWGVLHYADGKSVWANLPSEPDGHRPRLLVAGRTGGRPHPVAVRPPTAAVRDRRPRAGPRLPAHRLRPAHAAPRRRGPERLPPGVRRRRHQSVRGRARAARHRRREPVRPRGRAGRRAPAGRAASG